MKPNKINADNKPQETDDGCLSFEETAKHLLEMPPIKQSKIKGNKKDK